MLPPLDVPAADALALLGKEVTDLGVMPELSEIEIIRHFTPFDVELRDRPRRWPIRWAAAASTASRERVRLAPRRPRRGASLSAESLSQGASSIMKLLSDCLIEITGMDTITLQPAAGAHGASSLEFYWHARITSPTATRARRS